MDFIAFQYDRSFVLDTVHQGKHHYLEHVSEAAEADWFRHLIRRQLVQCFAESYPLPWKKEEVPVWIYLASEFSPRLHGAQSYHAFPRIPSCGGLIESLGPALGGRKTRDPETGDVTLACPGFNDKNDYDRAADSQHLPLLLRRAPRRQPRAPRACIGVSCGEMPPRIIMEKEALIGRKLLVHC